MAVEEVAELLADLAAAGGASLAAVTARSSASRATFRTSPEPFLLANTKAAGSASAPRSATRVTSLRISSGGMSIVRRDSCELCASDVEVLLVGGSGDPVTCAKGMRVVPDTSWDDLGDIDVLIYPGGRGTRTQLGNETIRARLRALTERGTLMASVCTGALVYADAGLREGRPAATHWAAFDELLPLGRDIAPQPDKRFVDDGEIITSAGVSAGIDMALHLVGRLSPDQAREVRRAIQYEPQPPS